MAGLLRVGMVVASAGRSTPGNLPNAPTAAITVAPVWPALKSASASPLRTASAANRMDARGFLRSAAAAGSSMPIDSGVSRMRDVERRHPRVARQFAFDVRRRPDQEESDLQMSRGHERAVDNAPRTVVAPHRVDGDAHQSTAGGLVTVGSIQFPVASFALLAGKSRDAHRVSGSTDRVVFSDKSNWLLATGDSVWLAKAYASSTGRTCRPL